jgi:hypothetical protein
VPPWRAQSRSRGSSRCVEPAPTRLRERYVSVFKTSMAVQQAFGPVLVTTVLVGWGRLCWLALALLLTAGTLASRRLGTRQIARRVRPTRQTPHAQDLAVP